MENIWEESLFKEIYNVNTTEYKLGTPGIRVQTFCSSQSRKNWKSDKNSRRSNIIAFIILSGKQQFIYPDGSKKKISPGFFSIINLNSIDYELQTISDCAERYFILLEVNSTILHFLNEMFPGGLPAFQSPDPLKLQKCFENIRDEITRPDADDAYISSAAYRLFHEAMSQLPATSLPVPLLLAENYINNHYHEVTLSRAEIANAACVSISTLGKLFRTCKNTTIHESISAKRMENVKQLLAFSNKSISEIALECGFSYSYYLCREFQTKFKMTPSQYRKKTRLQR